MSDQAPTKSIVTTQQEQEQSTNMLLQQSQQTTNNPSQYTEAQQKRFIQKQLVLLLHAHKCQQREKQTINDESTRSNACTLPHCSTMKSVLQHMTKCDDHKTCTVQHCITSRQIILHWKECNSPQCSICAPIKDGSALAKLNQQIATTTIADSTEISSINLNTNSNERSINIDWQRHVTAEMRNHLVQKIIAALLPITDTGAVNGKRIINLADYARRVENEIFEVAANQEEYFNKLAERIYKIQKDLEDGREEKYLQDMQLAAQISSANDFNGEIYSTIDTMADDHGPPNRTAPITDYVSSSAAAGNLLQSQTIKSELLTNVPSHDLDMLDTTENNLNGTNQLKNEPLSPKN
ncbi:unnamed protein product [Adineta steineri]|uniref:histone acetyltransferase n=2 Tax=Adineta steineri TaxID=433720 RepID=A0A819AIK0_9BILA|nr:unnamed protein product [Adineta steineri]